MSEAVSSDAITVDMIHNETTTGGLKAKTFGRVVLPQLISKLVDDVDTYDVVIGFNGTLFPLFKKLKARRQRPLLIDYVHGLSTFDRIVTLSEGEVGRNVFSWHYRLITGPLTGRLPETWEWRGACLADVVIVQNSRDREFLQRKGLSNIVQVALPVVPAHVLGGNHGKS